MKEKQRTGKKEKEAYKICLEKIKKHNLTMKLIKVEYTFDNNKVLFYFTADGRIDFRELVKDLASVFKTRIELRQIGVRDETKILGGIGSRWKTTSAVQHICQSSYQYLLRWQRSRISHLIHLKYQVCVDDLCAALRMSRKLMKSLTAIFQV